MAVGASMGFEALKGFRFDSPFIKAGEKPHKPTAAPPAEDVS
jgi:hypothetical protein